MNKSILVLIFVVCTISFLKGQENAYDFQEESLYAKDSTFLMLNNAIGVKLSNISGYGVYYNRKITDNINIQLLGLIYYYFKKESDEENNNLNYDIGIELQNNFLKIHNFRMYVLAGAYYYYDDDETIFKNYTTKLTNNSFNAGIGIGAEYYYKRFILSVDIGYKYFEDNKVRFTKDNKGIVEKPSINRVTKIGAGIGFGFMF